MESIREDVGAAAKFISANGGAAEETVIPGTESASGVRGAGLPNSVPENLIPGVPRRLATFRPANSTSREWTSYYDAFKTQTENGSINALCGKRGCGKSQIGACLVGYATVVLHKRVLYTKALEIFLRIRQAMNTSGDSELVAVNEYIKPYLLVIDAFEVRGDTAFENRIMDHIIDKRYDAILPTLIISNDNVETFVKHLGPSTVDRIAETGGIVELKTQSFRRRT